MAKEPFCPAPKASSTSRTSVFCKARTSVAKVSRLAPATARAESTWACRSRDSEAKALRKLRHPSRSRKLKAFLEGRT
jgi:hypothetical protein